MLLYNLTTISRVEEEQYFEACPFCNFMFRLVLLKSCSNVHLSPLPLWINNISLHFLSFMVRNNFPAVFFFLKERKKKTVFDGNL